MRVLTGAASATVQAARNRVLWSEGVAVTAMRPLLRLTAVLRRHVSQVVVRGTEKQMVRANARRIVAAMADVLTMRDGAVGHFIGQAMGIAELTVYRADFAIAECAFRGRPIPTFARLVNLRPETLLDRHPVILPLGGPV